MGRKIRNADIMVSFTIKVRKFFLSIAFLFLIAVCLGDIEASDRKTVTIIVNSATLREKPAFDSKPVTWAAKGAVFEAIEKFTDRKGKRWYKVRTSGGKECWIKEVAVKVSEPESADSQAQDKKVESASGDTEKHKAEDKIKEKSEGDAKKRAGENKHGKTAAVIIDAAPLRTRPFIVFSPVASGKKGAVYEVTGEYTGSNGRKWYKVRVSKDREYWLEGKAVKIKEETKGEPEGEKPRKEEPKTDIKTQDRKAEPADDSAKPKAVEKAKEKKEKNGKEGIQKEQLSDRSLPELLAKADAFYKEGKCEDFISSYKKAIDIAARQND
ncbi:MAG: SH3 domain-containing protein, partial [Nitrospirae bacterium]|nr:SH3 domain-containing protein [Nitrospirota bacterium]